MEDAITKEKLQAVGFSQDELGDWSRPVAGGKAQVVVGQFPFSTPCLMLRILGTSITIGNNWDMASVRHAIDLFDDSWTDDEVGLLNDDDLEEEEVI